MPHQSNGTVFHSPLKARSDSSELSGLSSSSAGLPGLNPPGLPTPGLPTWPLMVLGMVTAADKAAENSASACTRSRQQVTSSRGTCNRKEGVG